MSEAERLEHTRIDLQQETCPAYLSALRVVKKLEAELAACREDAERLKWIETEACTKGSILFHDGGKNIGIGLATRGIRSAIDAARREGK